MRKLSNRTKFQISLKSRDGETYYINPGATVDVPNSVIDLPAGVVETVVKVKDAPVEFKEEKIKTEAEKATVSNSVKE